MKKILLMILLMFPLNIKALENTIVYDGIEIEVKDTDEAIAKIDEIYDSMPVNDYFIKYEEGTVDLNKIDEYYKNKYVTDININTYSYKDYAYFQPNRFLPIKNENEFTISNKNKKITSEEEKKLEDFSKKFLKQFKGKSDYEKIYMAYSYISNHAVYQTEGVFENLIDGYLSAYDVLVTNKTVCIGSATAFSYLMDKLGITSYIVDHIASYDEEKGIYYSSHTYNVVKLDDKWYIVDIKYNNDLSGLLIGNTKYKDEKYNYDIVVSDEDYKRPEFTYEFKDETSEEIINENSESIYYIVLILILIIISLVIFIFTRKKKK